MALVKTLARHTLDSAHSVEDTHLMPALLAKLTMVVKGTEISGRGSLPALGNLSRRQLMASCSNGAPSVAAG
jgi:hypothetical protein